MTDFLYWSGVVAWVACGLVGIALALDWIIDNIIDTFWTKREFLAFVADRLKARSEKP